MARMSLANIPDVGQIPRPLRPGLSRRGELTNHPTPPHLKKTTNTLFHISRNFVEFGPFTAPEIVGFRERGVLSDHDYVRSAASHDWLPLAHWLNKSGSGPVESKAAARPAPRKRSTPAAKAPKKAA